MSSAWLLPEHFADVLPAQARRIEELRRQLLDAARRHGFELVIPPLLEHLDSLLSGAGKAQNLRTFKLVDQLSGRSLGVRADMTPQVARIDAHLLNRVGVTRLCYCGSVVHTRPDGPLASREPLQFGVEVYGHPGLEADLEVLGLAAEALMGAGLSSAMLELGDARCLEAVLDAARAESAQREAVRDALLARSQPALREAAAALDTASQAVLQTLLQLGNDGATVDEARSRLPALPGLQTALDDLARLLAYLKRHHPMLRAEVNLAAVPGNAYYTGVCFGGFVDGVSQPILRGGRYDAVGAAFGRVRPAVGFSVDLKTWVEALPESSLQAAIRAPWADDEDLHRVVRQLRQRGETVVFVLPGHEDEGQEYACDRELFLVVDQGWAIRPLDPKL